MVKVPNSGKVDCPKEPYEVVYKESQKCQQLDEYINGKGCGDLVDKDRNIDASVKATECRCKNVEPPGVVKGCFEDIKCKSKDQRVIDWNTQVWRVFEVQIIPLCRVVVDYVEDHLKPMQTKPPTSKPTSSTKQARDIFESSSSSELGPMTEDSNSETVAGSEASTTRNSDTRTERATKRADKTTIESEGTQVELDMPITSGLPTGDETMSGVNESFLDELEARETRDLLQFAEDMSSEVKVLDNTWGTVLPERILVDVQTTQKLGSSEIRSLSTSTVKLSPSAPTPKQTPNSTPDADGDGSSGSSLNDRMSLKTCMVVSLLFSTFLFA